MKTLFASQSTILQILLNPPSCIQDDETKDRIRYLTIILIVAIISTTLLVVWRILDFLMNQDPKKSTTIFQASFWVVILVILFIISKTRFYNVALGILFLIPLLQPWSGIHIYLAYPDADLFMVNATMVVVVALVGFSFLYNEKTIIIYTILASVNLFVFYYIILLYPIHWLYPKYVTTLCVAVFCVLGIRYRSKLFKSLKHSNKALELKTEELLRSNQELEQFAHIVSHDLKNPLQTIIGFTELLLSNYKGKILDDNACVFVEFTVNGARRMGILIDEILQNSRITKKMDLDQIINLNEILKTVKMNLSAVIEKNNVIIDSEQLPEVVGNKMQIIRLFQNLIDNAIKYRSKNTPEIVIRAKQQNNCWCFSIKDNGIGIDPKFHEKIFLDFQRLHTEGEIPGTGIGLSVCKKIIEQHGGKIWIESEENFGSTFFFTLPK